MIKKVVQQKYRHLFHIVLPSYWPFFLSINLLTLVIHGILYLNSYQFGGILFFISFLAVVNVLFQWWNDIIIEATYNGDHTRVVQYGLRIGMMLFIISEVMFFFAFFWSYFFYSLNPTIHIGEIWPPKGVDIFNPYGIPLLNTIILLFSGFYVTIGHNIFFSFKNYFAYRKYVQVALFVAIFLGILFFFLQMYEYSIAAFSINDSVYGSIFFLITGFHGFHVFVGTIFLIVMFIRELLLHFVDLNFENRYFFGIEAAIWYWHFVDVIWLFLFIVIYWYGW